MKEKGKAKTEAPGLLSTLNFKIHILDSECSKYSSFFLQHTGRLRGKISHSLLGDLQPADGPNTRLPLTFLTFLLRAKQTH